MDSSYISGLSSSCPCSSCEHTYPDTRKRTLLSCAPHSAQFVQHCTFPMWAHRVGSRWKGACVTFSSTLTSISLAMSLLNVPFVRFPPVLSSPTCPTSRTSATSVAVDKTPVPPLTGVECLAALPIRHQTHLVATGEHQELDKVKDMGDSSSAQRDDDEADTEGARVKKRVCE